MTQIIGSFVHLLNWNSRRVDDRRLATFQSFVVPDSGVWPASPVFQNLLHDCLLQEAALSSIPLHSQYAG